MTNYMQPVLIELNTREVRDGLRALGYEVVYTDECPENYGWATGAGHAVILRPEQFDYWTTSVPTAKRINCGKNIDLFLALAALRNDYDNEQYFIAEKNVLYMEGKKGIKVIANKGEFKKCDEIPLICASAFKKATVGEIVEHFCRTTSN